MGIDLPLLWLIIIAFVLMMYVIMDGSDLGIGILLPFVPDRAERDTMVNTVAPVWDGNETWLVLGGAALLAAFPLVYSVGHLGQRRGQHRRSDRNSDPHDATAA